MSSSSILIIGGGNMGAGLAMRWHEAFADTPIVIAETDAARREKLRSEGLDAPDEVDVPPDGFAIVVLAVKPQGFAELAPQLPAMVGDATLVSIMAGVPLAALQSSGAAHIVRAMPNTPAMIGEGMSALFAPDLPPEKLQEVQELFAATGRVLWVDNEAELHAITAISGSGPAYLFAFMEALERSAVAMGIDAQAARLLVRQTMVGGALMAEFTQMDPARLRAQVTSPGGTTEAALAVFHAGDLNRLVSEAVLAAQARSKALS